MAQISYKQNLAAKDTEGDTWDSGWINVGSAADHIVGSVYADQVCEVKIQQSGDSENVDYETTITTTANKGSRVYEEIILPYYRIVASNPGGVDTTDFRAYIKTSSAGPR